MDREQDRAIERILSQFPGPVTIRSLTLRSSALVTMILAGILLLLEAIVADGPDLRVQIVVGLTIAVIWLVTLLIGARHLSLDGGGFEVDSLFSRRSEAWRDVAAFEVILTDIGRGVRVPLVYCRVCCPSSNDDPMCKGQPNEEWVGSSDPGAHRNTVLEKDALDRWFLTKSFEKTWLSADSLAQLMTLWRDRAVAARRSPN
jgi:hypothetical protein